MTEKAVEFRSGEDVCKGVLTMPEGASGDVPLVIMAGGWCYTKEIVMPHYSKFFHDIGCATLRFDYRRFGESTGEPRQHINPWDQIEDYRNALSYAATLPGIDKKRTGIWGISYSGGHVLVTAALDSRAAFAISTIPVVDGFQTMRRCHGEVKFAQLLALIQKDREARFRGEQPGYMPMSPEKLGEELTSWPFPHVFAGFKGIQATEAPRHEHRNTIQSVELLLQYMVKPYAARIVETPVMMTLAHADNITSADLEVEVFNAIASPDKQFESVRGVDHMSLYTNREHLAKVGRVQSRWLKELLDRGE
ncbi:CocE/NonD family hydrolase [Ramlibacter sp. AN1015]|uniref:alpha/beta hydrolase n=1 Tax=Ramlibacter sp. AN1015 TaxID=3133428 RepID=UPI0030C21D96